MPPPLFRLGSKVVTKLPVPARICLGKNKGYRKVVLPPGKYHVTENARNEDYGHNVEYSDGYTYRLLALERQNPLCGKRLSIWQNDLYEAASDEKTDELE